MHYYILSSGSKGNCSVICSEKTRIIIDCGNTKKYLEECFTDIGIDYRQCDGLLITHSHSDHIKQVKMFKQLPIYSAFPISGIDTNRIAPYKIFKINDLSILPIALSHDTEITLGYIISDGKEVLVQITDTGYLSSNNQQLIKNAHYYIFESNHDPEMLMKTDRPMCLKQRILSDNGHMSNSYCANVLKDVIGSKTREIILAHISQEANTYELAKDTLVNTLRKENLLTNQLYIKAIEQFEIYHGGN